MTLWFGFIEHTTRKCSLDQNVELERVGFVVAGTDNTIKNRKRPSIQYLARRYMEKNGGCKFFGGVEDFRQYGSYVVAPEELAPLAYCVIEPRINADEQIGIKGAAPMPPW